MELTSSSRATRFFCANKKQLYKMNTVAKCGKATCGRSKLCKERDKAKHIIALLQKEAYLSHL